MPSDRTVPGTRTVPGINILFYTEYVVDLLCGGSRPSILERASIIGPTGSMDGRERDEMHENETECIKRNTFQSHI